MKLFFTFIIFTVIIYGVSIIEAAKRRTTRAPAVKSTTKQPVRKLWTKWYRCNFENGYCGWKNDSTAEFQWYRTAEQTPTGETGPRWDHTKAGAPGGHFLYIEASTPQENGDHARLISPTLMEQGVFCLKFWHNMHGADVRDLNVYIRGMKSKKQTTISHLSGPWSVAVTIKNDVGEDNDWWNEESLEFTVREPAKIVFEGVRGTSYRGDIAIDDIDLRKGRCPLQSINCNFENSTCGWTQVSRDQFNWLPNRGRTDTTYTGPAHDHTLQNPNGRYLYAETSWPRVEGDKAQLQSPRISCDKGATPVFNFWYNMNGIHMGPLRIYATRDKRLLGDPIWDTSGDHGDKWFLGQAIPSQGLVSKGFFYIIIEAERKEYRGDVAIDDVSLTGCRQDEEMFGKLSSLTTPTTTAQIKTSESSTEAVEGHRLRDVGDTNVLPGGINCDFEHESICSWRQDEKDDVDWDLKRGRTPSANTGPASDHTTRKGWYLFVEASDPTKPRDTASLRSPSIHPSIKSCISFYYHMHGKNMGKLELFSVARGATKLRRHWWKQGQQSKNNTDWRFAAVTISHSVAYEIVIRATVGGGFYSDIAVDDIKVDPKSCDVDTSPKEPTQTSMTADTTISSTESTGSGINCDFGQGTLCDWSQASVPMDDFNWTISTGQNMPSSSTGPVYDHTAGSSGGYVYIEASTPRNIGDSAMLLSPVYKVEKEMCFHFWYHMYGEGTGNLTVFRKIQGSGKLVPLWSSEGNKGDKWLEGLIPLRKLANTELVVEARRGGSWCGDIALDDFKIEEGKCPTFDCDFEEDNCAWTQEFEHDDFNWTRNSGPTKSKHTGPQTDHTLGTANGTYLYIETSNPQLRFDKAWLISPMVDPGRQSAKCLTFWYHAFGDHVGEINVFKKPAMSNDTYLGSTQLALSQNQGDQWLFASTTIHDTFPYQIIIEGKKGLDYLGDMAIDDIKLTDGACDPCCGDNKFKCGNHFCISKSLQCNHQDDCGDGSDESFCKLAYSDEPVCGTPFSYAPIREPEVLPTHNIAHDEGIREPIMIPEEELESIESTFSPDNAESAMDDLKIADWQLRLFRIPRLLFGRLNPNSGLYAGNPYLDLDGGKNPETIREKERRKRDAPARDFSSEYSTTIDLLKLQTAEMFMDTGRIEQVSLEDQKLVVQHKERRQKVLKSFGKQHRLSPDEWAMVKPGKREKSVKSRRERRSVKKIIGGVRTSQYNYPWQVAYYVTNSQTKDHYFCGATLIDRYWIITAAHCPHLGDVHSFVLGDYDLYTDEGTEQEMLVDALFVHSKYEFGEDLIDDVALIKLRYPAKQSNAVQPACMLKTGEEPFEPGHICVTTGWGRTDPGVPGVERYLRQVEMPIISNTECKNTFWSIYKIHDSYVCAGGTGGNSCRGDSGGPLLCKKDDRFYLVGITSWGDTRCKPHIPGVYTRVQSYNKWMKAIMSRHECREP